MKRLLILVAIFGVWEVSAQMLPDSANTHPKKYSLPIENNISYKESLNYKSLDYNLEPVSDGRFKLIFVNQPTEYVRIKIYDIIGNLILEEDNKYALNAEIEYNFNEQNAKIFVVKVEAGEDNLVKKVNF